MRQRLIAGLAVLLLAGCGDFPRDPRHTTELARETGELRVGLIHNPPWTDTRGRAPAGREVELIAGFAEALGTTPRWRVYAEHEGFAALEHGEIDVLAGGLVKKTPYRKAAFTRPYAEARNGNGQLRRHVIALRRGENRLLVALEGYLRRHGEQVE